MLDTIQTTTAEPAYVQIARQVRREIQLGRLTPGQRLPSSLELVEKWRVGYQVVHDALATLAAEGLLERAPRRGTFVSPKVARTMIGLLFGPRLADEQAHFYRAGQKALETEILARGWACRTYDHFSNSEGRPHPPETQVYQDLANDAQCFALKGLVQFDLGEGGLVHPAGQRGLPKVALESSENGTDFDRDWSEFGRNTVQFLAAKGCKKIMCLLGTHQPSRARSSKLDTVFLTARELGLPAPSIEWLVTPARGEPLERAAYEQAGRVVRGWRDKADGRPDALLVMDDIMMRGVGLALLDHGLKTPRDLRVLVCTCEEVNLWYGMPVARHEISLRRIAKEMLDLLQRRIAGRSLPKLPIKYTGQIREEE